jgi:membrane protein implicated in regulation of membrane protease activity
MEWWLWVVIGLGLLALEIALPGGFFAAFFGISALAVGALAGLGWAGPAWMQWLLFTGLAIAALALLRKRLKQRLGTIRPGRAVDSIPGEVAIAQGEIAVGAIGKAELRGTSWNARNVGATAIPAGRRCMVDRVEGLMLLVHLE